MRNGASYGSRAPALGAGRCGFESRQMRHSHMSIAAAAPASASAVQAATESDPDKKGGDYKWPKFQLLTKLQRSMRSVRRSREQARASRRLRRHWLASRFQPRDCQWWDCHLRVCHLQVCHLKACHRRGCHRSKRCHWTISRTLVFQLRNHSHAMRCQLPARRQSSRERLPASMRFQHVKRGSDMRS